MVARHYGRFLPQDEAEIAARILNKVGKRLERCLLPGVRIEYAEMARFVRRNSCGD